MFCTMESYGILCISEVFIKCKVTPLTAYTHRFIHCFRHSQCCNTITQCRPTKYCNTTQDCNTTQCRTKLQFCINNKYLVNVYNVWKLEWIWTKGLGLRYWRHEKGWKAQVLRAWKRGERLLWMKLRYQRHLSAGCASGQCYWSLVVSEVN